MYSTPFFALIPYEKLQRMPGTDIKTYYKHQIIIAKGS